MKLTVKVMDIAAQGYFSTSPMPGPSAFSKGTGSGS